MSKIELCGMCGIELIGAEFCGSCGQERRIAWDRYAAAAFGDSDANCSGAAKAADALLAERDARFCRKECKP